MSPSKWNKLVANLVHGESGVSWPNARFAPCFFLELEYFKHSWQLSTNFSGWSFNPGQYTVCFACNLHLLSQRWLSWMWLRIFSRFLLGMTILVPFKMRPSSMVSFPWNVQYGCRTGDISLIVLGHPDMIVCFNNARSAWVASPSSCSLLLLAGSCCDIWYTCNFDNLIVSFWSPNLDRQSASKYFGPGIYLIVKLCGEVLIKMHCSLGVAWLRLLDRITSSGFWSVSSIKWHPYRKWWNFSTAQATARDLLSIATYPLCVSVRALLAKYMGFSSCSRQTPRPFVLVSVCRTVSFWGL